MYWRWITIQWHTNTHDVVRCGEHHSTRLWPKFFRGDTNLWSRTNNFTRRGWLDRRSERVFYAGLFVSVLHGNSWFADVTAATKTRVKALAWQYQVALLSLIKSNQVITDSLPPSLTFGNAYAALVSASFSITIPFSTSIRRNHNGSECSSTTAHHHRNT
jgi:hypothetical protein